MSLINGSIAQAFPKIVMIYRKCKYGNIKHKPHKRESFKSVARGNTVFLLTVNSPVTASKPTWTVCSKSCG